MNNLTLKRASDKDLYKAEDILKQNDLMYEDIRSNNIELFFAYKNNIFTGIIGLERFNNLGFLRSLVILEEYRKKGCGREICIGLLNYAKSKGIKEVYLLTTTAKNFFEKINFNLVKPEKIPKAIKNTGQFSYFCPDSAACLKINL